MAAGEKKEKKASRWVIISAAVLFGILAVLFLLFRTSAGRRVTAKVAAGYIHENVQYVPSGKTGEGTEPSGRTDRTDSESDPRQLCILLLGEEAMGTRPGSGRTDLIMLAAVSVPDKSVKLVSLLRDTLVEIPGVGEAKLNAVYQKGGVELLYQVIEKHYGILPDAYALVGFDGFEELIDRLGGVEAELTEEEAQYLNTTKYISKPEERNVVPGKQTLSGAQALGYCRVRKVANINGKQFDYGRAERQRMVLQSLFRHYIDAGIYRWASLLRDIIGLVQTDISQEMLEELLFTVSDNSVTGMETMQIPAAGAFGIVEKYGNVGYVLIPDWEGNRKLLLEFMK